MAWTPKTWVNRSVQHAGRYVQTPTGSLNEYDMEKSEGTVFTAGDKPDATNLNSLETRIGEGFADVGLLANLTTGIKTSIVNAINWIVPRLKPATVGAKKVVATAIAAGNVFSEFSDGEYQIKASFSTIAGYIVITHSNGQVFRIVAAATPNYEQFVHIKVNAGQVITIFLLNEVTGVEVAFFPMI